VIFLPDSEKWNFFKFGEGSPWPGFGMFLRTGETINITATLSRCAGPLTVEKGSMPTDAVRIRKEELPTEVQLAFKAVEVALE